MVVSRIFYDVQTGNVITYYIRNSADGFVPVSVDEDFNTFSALKERVRETVGVKELLPGSYAQDFASCSGFRIDPATKEILFAYSDPNTPEAPPVYQVPLTEQVAELKSQNSEIILTLVMNDLM